MIDEFQLTFSSVISIIGFSLCFAVLLILALRSNKLLGSVKYELLLFCLAAPLIRLLVPVEILPWTQNLNMAWGLPKLTDWLHKSMIIGENPMTIWEIIVRVGIVASAVVTIGAFVCYVLEMRRVKNCSVIEEARYQEIINKILAGEGKTVKFTVRRADFVKSPAVFGMVRPSILLPNVELSDNDLENVLRHEIAHYLHGDLIICFGWVLIRSICCWNPAVYFLNGQLGKLLEIRADENATKKLTEREQDAYMKTLINLGRINGPLKNRTGFTAAYMQKGGLTVEKRMDIILCREERSRAGFILKNLILSLCVIVLTVAMNCLIVEPYEKLTDDDYSSSTMATEGNSFFVINEEGTYDMYFGGVYCATLEDSRGSNLPVYESLEEAMKYETIK